jgi:hypothetical protein
MGRKAQVDEEAAPKRRSPRSKTVEAEAPRGRKAPPPLPGWLAGPRVKIKSLPDNRFIFAALGDFHAGSKYCRYDVREDLVRRAEEAGAQAILDSGNWVDGEAKFNKYDLEAVGMDAQCALLAKRHPKTKLPIYAVAGDDHEGWYGQREGVDIGRYAQNIMREAGHDWHDLGYMEAHIALVNANSGKKSILAVVHPGGGSAYALSYRPQKIIEALEGGEKPAVLLLGRGTSATSGTPRQGQARIKHHLCVKMASRRTSAA